MSQSKSGGVPANALERLFSLALGLVAAQQQPRWRFHGSTCVSADPWLQLYFSGTGSRSSHANDSLAKMTFGSGSAPPGGGRLGRLDHRQIQMLQRFIQADVHLLTPALWPQLHTESRRCCAGGGGWRWLLQSSALSV